MKDWPKETKHVVPRVNPRSHDDQREVPAKEEQAKPGAWAAPGSGRHTQGKKNGVVGWFGASLEHY